MRYLGIHAATNEVLVAHDSVEEFMFDEVVQAIVAAGHNVLIYSIDTVLVQESYYAGIIGKGGFTVPDWPSLISIV